MAQDQNNSTFPKWVTIYLWIVTLMATAFSILAYLKPDVQFGTWEALSASGALSLAGPLGLYIARNLATAISGFYALTQKSAPMAKLLLVLRLVTDGLDAIHNGMAGNMPGAGFAAVMFAIEAFALFSVSKK